jgi:hypothetical protein
MFVFQSSDFLNTNVEHGNSERTLQHLTIGSPDALVNHSVLPSTDFTQFTSNSQTSALDALVVAQAEIDLQLQMQMQIDNFTWDSTSVWSSIPLEDDFDINAIPPIELGVPQHIDNIHVANPGQEHRQDFSHYCGQSVDAGFLGFEDTLRL